jgi:putative membrane protein
MPSLRDAAAGGIAEVKLGQLALQNASSSEVKAFAQQMVTDHTKANADLTKVAGGQHISLPTAMSDKDQALYNQLSSLKGNDFDEAYTKAMLEDHKQDVSDFEKEAAEGTNDALRQFATRTLPTLRDHLKKIEIVSRSLTIEKPSA